MLMIDQLTIELFEFRETVHVHLFTQKAFLFKDDSPEIFNFGGGMFFDIGFDLQALGFV